MADTWTRPGTDRRPLISYLRIQRDLDAEMRVALRSASTRISEELRRLENNPLIGSQVRRDQLALSQQAIHRHNERMFLQVGNATAAAQERAAAAAVESTFPLTALKSVMPEGQAELLLRSQQMGAARSVEQVKTRMELSKIPLSEQVWQSAALANGKVDEIINSALARGASAHELARDVRSFVNPDTPGGTKYAAMRLGRTELNNAFHATQVRQGIDSPFVVAMRWNLSGSHPRPDECNEYADQVHYEGGEAGVYRPEEVPAKPHPNCLCFCTPETDSVEDFLKKFQKGDYDSYLEEMGAPSAAVRDSKAVASATAPSQPVKKPPTTTPSWAKTRTPQYVVNDLAKQTVRKINPDDLQTLEDYVNNGAFIPLNVSLRGGDLARATKGLEDMFDVVEDIDPGWVAQMTQYMDEAVSKGRTMSEMTLYRGFDPEYLSDLKRGSVFTDRGFISSSVDPDVAMGFGDTIMKITYPRGKPALYIDALEDLTLAQKEVLLPRNVQFKVTSIQRDASGRKIINVKVTEDRVPDTIPAPAEKATKTSLKKPSKPSPKKEAPDPRPRGQRR